MFSQIQSNKPCISFRPGDQWLDTDGLPIQASGCTFWDPIPPCWHVQRSDLLCASGPSIALDLPIFGVRKLLLRAWYPVTIASGHAIWADAMVHPSV